MINTDMHTALHSPVQGTWVVDVRGPNSGMISKKT